MQGIHVFLNGARGLPVIESLYSAGHTVASAITILGKPVFGLDTLCQKLNIEMREIESVGDEGFLIDMRALRPELFVIAGFPSIFRRPLFDLPQWGTINLHGGPVPRYRGGSPLNWQMINGETHIGISVLRMDDGIDTGQVLAETSFALGPRDTIADVHAKANKRFPEMVLSAVAQIQKDPESGRLQDESAARYWHQRNDADGKLNFGTMTAHQIDCMVRALGPPYSGAYAHVNGRTVRMLSTSIPEFVLCGYPGRVCYIQGRGPYVVCRDRAVWVEKHVIEGEATVRLRHGDVLQ